MNITRKSDEEIAVLASAPLKEYYIFNEQGLMVGPWTRKTNCWVNSVSGISSIAGYLSVTLITPDVFLYAVHNNPLAGNTAYFVSEDGNNTNYSRTILSTSNLSGPAFSTQNGDMGVGRFAEPLPPSVVPAQILIPTSLDYMNTNGVPFAVIQSDQENRISCAQVLQITPQSFPVPSQQGFFAVTDYYAQQPFSKYTTIKRLGDSGRACGLILKNRFVLLFGLTFGGSGSGWVNFFYVDRILDAIRSLGGDETISFLDPKTLT